MFTGIITALGRITDITPATDHTPLKAVIAAPVDAQSLTIGASIACDGVCLTVTTIEPDHEDKTRNGCHFSVDISPETLACTTLNCWQPGTLINLEPSLKLGDEMGGHMVTGHVDAIATLDACDNVKGSWRISLTMADDILPFIAEKGSIAINGVSLTVNQVHHNRVELMLIPHTWNHTTFHALSVGDAVNVEVDLMARYAARWFQSTSTVPAS